jgi:hypothetical protein
MNDIAARQIRRRLEVLQMPVPRPEVLDEIVDFCERELYVSRAEMQQRIYDAVETELEAQGPDTREWNDGYAAAIAEIEALAEGNDVAGTSGDGTPGPTAA